MVVFMFMLKDFMTGWINNLNLKRNMRNAKDNNVYESHLFGTHKELLSTPIPDMMKLFHGVFYGQRFSPDPESSKSCPQISNESHRSSESVCPGATNSVSGWTSSTGTE